MKKSVLFISVFVVHHASSCNGRNGYVTAIDLNTLQLVPEFKAEVSVDPYGYSITN